MKFLFLIFFALVLCSACIANNVKEDFWIFMKRFTSDSIFQTERVVFPLQVITWDSDTDKETIVFIQRHNYKFDILFRNIEQCSEAYPVFYNNFNCDFGNSDEIVFQWKGFVESDDRYYFKRIKSKWFLVKRMDYYFDIDLFNNGK